MNNTKRIRIHYLDTNYRKQTQNTTVSESVAFYQKAKRQGFTITKIEDL